jgi:hypothetical protein
VVRKTLRRWLLPGAVLAVALALTGCGGGSGIPDDASVKDFCKAGDTFAAATRFSEGVKAADKLHDTGTPKHIPAEARHGFELVVRMVTDAKDQADLEKRYQKLTTGQKKSIDKLDGYLTKTC